jgi:hypothetical protein
LDAPQLSAMLLERRLVFFRVGYSVQVEALIVGLVAVALLHGATNQEFY